MQFSPAPLLLLHTHTYTHNLNKTLDLKWEIIKDDKNVVGSHPFCFLEYMDQTAHFPEIYDAAFSPKPAYK